MKENKKLKLLYLRDILLSKSSEETKLSITDIAKHLEQKNIYVERKTIYSDIKSLEDYGIDIIKERGKENRYHIGERTFELPELKLLVDAIATSRFIPEKKSKELIGKIGTLTSESESKKLKRQIIITNRPKTTNKNIYYNIDKLHEAIATKKQVTFKYFDIDINWQKIYHQKQRTVDPYTLTWGNETYYLIGYHHEDEKLKHFRIDKMEEVQILDKKVYPITRNINLANYSKSVFSMFGSENTTLVELEFEEQLIGTVRDKFGNEINIIKQPEKLSPNQKPTFRTRVEIALSPTFYGWMLYFGNKAKIINPKEARQEYINLLEESLENMKRE